MRKPKYNFYGIDINYEFRTYRKVGRDYGITKKKERLKYKVCNTYSEWECHAKSILNKDICNYNDFIHWLYKQHNDAKAYFEIVRAILIPLYITLITVFNIFDSENASGYVSEIIVIGFIAAITTVFLYSSYQKVIFFEDLIKITEENNEKYTS